MLQVGLEASALGVEVELVDQTRIKRGSRRRTGFLGGLARVVPSVERVGSDAAAEGSLLW
jgi:hypothetical protein